MSFRIDAVNDDTYLVKGEEPKQPKKPKKKLTVPMVKEEKTEDLSKLPQGYKVETNVDNNDITDDENGLLDDKNSDEEVIDHDIDTKQRIHTRKSIAEHTGNQYKSTIMNEVEGAIFDDISDDDDVGTDYIQALDDVKDNNTEIFNNVPEKLHLYGNGTTEFSGYKYSDNENTDITTKTQTYEGALGLTYGKKYKNDTELKFIGYCYASSTTDNTKAKISLNSDSFTIPEDADINEEDYEDILNEENLEDIPNDKDLEETFDENNSDNNCVNFSLKDKSIDVKAFLAAQYKFKNKDTATGTVSYMNDGSGDARIDGMARYDNNKYHMYGQFNITNYINRPDEKDQTTHKTVVTNFKVGFNQESEDIDETAESIKENNISNPQIQECAKKWTKKIQPYIISRNIGANFENGFGIDQFFKRTTNNSQLSLVPFGQYSLEIEPKDEESLDFKHNIAFGGNINYTKYTNKGLLNFGTKLRNRYTLGEGNSFTLTADASYKTEQISVAAQTMYIKVPQSDYFGTSVDFTYNPRKAKWLETFVSGQYVNIKKPDSKSEGSSVQAGVRANF